MGRRIKEELKDMIYRLYPDYDPVAAMAGIAQDPNVEMSVRVRCHESVAKYMHAQLKTVEIRSEGPTETFSAVKLNVVRSDHKPSTRH
jgi:hypothetical protein